MDQTYTYAGPLSAVSLPADAAHPQGRQIMLHPGKPVALPADSDYVQTLLARGHLTPVSQPVAATAQLTFPVEAKPAPATPSAIVSPTTAPAASAAETTTGVTHGS